jgi:NADP-reducing hydrogenase subunit HndD
MEKMIHLTINGQEVETVEGSTILEAARHADIDIPTLCYLKDINEIGACRMCLVEVEGMRTLQAACVYPVREGMVVHTHSKRVRDARKINLELILSNHERSCLSCLNNNHCELRTLAGKLGITNIRFDVEPPHRIKDESNPSLVRNNNKCILCRRCVAVCKHIQKVEAIDVTMRGMESHIGNAFDRPAQDSECILCGQCITVCPTGALREKRNIDDVWKAIGDKSKHVVVQVAPAVRAALGEEFGYPMGTNVAGKMVTALRSLGFDKVFDTNTGADLTILEEGNELLHRIQNGGTLPMITSCSPGWIKYCEHFFPEFIPNLSTCKSPHMMFGAMIKSYYAKIANIDPKDIVVVSVMPCVAKKFEVSREEFEVDGHRDVDYVITTRELAAMIKEASINFDALEDTVFDNPFNEASGAAAIFGVTGGVMEAALRTVAETIIGRDLDSVDFIETRGKTGKKEVFINAGGTTLKGLVISGVGNAKDILTTIKENGGQSQYHFIEVMGCPGGCIMGGGQPIYDSITREHVDVFAKRSSVLYSIDSHSKVRKSHKNPDIIKLYDEFLGKPNSEIAHKYLHTHYVARGRYGNTK